MKNNEEFEKKAINTLRFLSVDAIQKANSGHPGLPMGAATMAYTIWTRHLKFNPDNPNWYDRDRFILSGGHGSMLLYSLLYLTGYDLSLDELKRFRQWGSKTPGHPEYHLTPGVEVTTGPLGQGFANGVGMAMAEAHLASIFNQPDYKIIDHYVYAIVTDGDLMEGIASEAASLAGHLQLGKLIYLYDDNRISIDGSTEIAFTEDRIARFKAYNWHVQVVSDGNDVDAIDKAIINAKQDPRPSFIAVRTHIGYGLPTRQDTPKAHGEPPGEEELAGAKKNLGWITEPKFFVPEDVLDFYRSFREKGQTLENKWNKLFGNYKQIFPELSDEYSRRMNGQFPDNWMKTIPDFKADEKGMATRAASGKVINYCAEILPELMGGSADLAPSNKTWINTSVAFEPGTYEGRNIHFGVREHAMGAAVNGLAVHGGIIPYGGTFLVFSDYLRPAIRISALSHYPSIWVFTHDSIGLGEDGPTHQPIEQIASLRAIPNLKVIRPADANEVKIAWEYAIEEKGGPVALILTRQAVPTFDRKKYSSADQLLKGAYVLKDFGNGKPDLIMMASGSEVSIIIKAAEELAKEGIKARVVSFPSWELFTLQNTDYQNSVLLPDIKKRISVEAGIAQGWQKWVGDQGITISIERFGASAPYEKLYEEFGFTFENVYQRAKGLFSK